MEDPALETPEVTAIVEPKTPLPPLPLLSNETQHEKVLSQVLERPAIQLEEDDPNIIDFEENDPENPLNWPTWRKWVTVILVCITRMLVNFATVTIVPAVPQVLEEFHVTNNLYSTLLVSIWEMGEGIGPFFVGPFSELFGRMPVYHIGNLLFILCSIASALSTNISMLVAFRFLNGFVITSLTLGPSIVGDLFKKENRGSAMAVAIALPLMGPFAAPVVGAYVAQAKGWRWTIWIIVMTVGLTTVLSLALVRETYKVKVLRRKAERLRKSTGNHLLRSKYQDAAERTSFWTSMLRPMRMMLSPIVSIVALYTALTYGISYLILTTLTQIMETNYGFGQGAVGLAFLGRAVGNIIGMLLYRFTSDRHVRQKAITDGYLKPEHRLSLMVFGSIFLPIGLIFYGWTAQFRVQFMAPIIGTAIVGFSMLLTVLPTENYLVDVYDLHSASAVGAAVVMRALFGALLPLAGPPLYAALGLGWGNSLLAFIALAFIPALVVLQLYGERIRKSRRFHVGL